MHQNVVRLFLVLLFVPVSLNAQSLNAQGGSRQNGNANRGLNGAQQTAQTPEMSRSSRPLTPAEYAEMQRRYQPQVPEGFPLSKEHQEYLAKVLDYWQHKSSTIKRSTASFRSWEYDPQLCQFRDPKTNKLVAHKIQDGKIRFANPDKGQYEVEQMWVFEPKKDANGQLQPAYNASQSKSGLEKWICDGKSIYEYDFQDSRLYETEIPAQLRGNEIVNSPLPFFLFGAKKELMLNRYWLRPVTPRSAKNEIWLEAYPKTLTDARNYKKLEIILSTEDWLPRSLHIYSPNYDIAKNPQSRAYEFRDRRMNGQLTAIQDFFKVFVRPQKPLGWTWVKRDVVPETAKQPNVPFKK